MTLKTADDLVRAAVQGNPAEVQDIFNELMLASLEDKIAEKKVELATTLFGGEQPPKDPTETEEIEDVVDDEPEEGESDTEFDIEDEDGFVEDDEDGFIADDDELAAMSDDELEEYIEDLETASPDEGELDDDEDV